MHFVHGQPKINHEEYSLQRVDFMTLRILFEWACWVASIMNLMNCTYSTTMNPSHQTTMINHSIRTLISQYTPNILPLCVYYSASIMSLVSFLLGGFQNHFIETGCGSGSVWAYKTRRGTCHEIVKRSILVYRSAIQYGDACNKTKIKITQFLSSAGSWYFTMSNTHDYTRSNENIGWVSPDWGLN